MNHHKMRWSLVLVILASLLLVISPSFASEFPSDSALLEKPISSTLALHWLQPDAEDALTAAWKKARDAGSYGFTAEITQIMIPLPLPENAGQSDTRVHLGMQGDVQLPDRATIDLWARTGNVNATPVTLIRDGNQTFMRQEGVLTEVDDPAGLAAPAGDMLGYLAAAEQVHELEPIEAGGETFLRYAFAIDGERLAQHVREQVQTELEESGELPPEMQLGLSPTLKEVTGQGELWVNAAGLPARQIIDLDVPKASDAYAAQLHMVVQLTDYGKQVTIPQAIQSPDGSWQLDGAGESASAATNSTSSLASPALFEVSPSGIVLFLFCFLLVATIRLYQRRPRIVYATVAIVMALLMVAGPLAQTGRIVRFVEHQAEAADARTAATPQLVEALGLSDPKPTPSADATPATLNDSPADDATKETEALQPPMVPNQIKLAATDPKAAISQCGDGQPGVDTDTDGVSDQVEACLGTDPYEKDTDRDGLSDLVETTGFSFAGRTWTTDPQNVDSNRDTLSDLLEWAKPIGLAASNDPDGDNVPNVWDADNDGDGVPDDVDMSPMAVSSYRDAFSISTQSSGFTGYEYIEFHVQPQNQNHLRYGTTALDWPHDDKGNIQDLDDSTDDIRLIPFLFITTNARPSDEMAQKYGFNIWESDDGGYTLLVPLVPVQDGGAVRAFYGKVGYEPDGPGGAVPDVNWQARMVWMVQGEVDSAVRGDRIKTQMQVLQQWDDTFRFSGLQITKSGSFEAAVFGVPGSPAEDRNLMALQFGLQASFLGYKELEYQEVDQTALEHIQYRFANAFPLNHTWGVPYADVATMRETYTHRDVALAQIGGDLVPTFLDTHFHSTSCDVANGDSFPCGSVVLATEYSVGLTDLASFSAQAGALNINLGAVAMLTQRDVKLNMYADQSGWQVMEAGDMLDVVEQRYSAHYADFATDSGFTHLDAGDMQYIGYLAYISAHAGASSDVTFDGKALIDGTSDAMELANTLLKLNDPTVTGANNVVNYYGRLTGIDAALDRFQSTNAMQSAQEEGINNPAYRPDILRHTSTAQMWAGKAAPWSPSSVAGAIDLIHAVQHAQGAASGDSPWITDGAKHTAKVTVQVALVAKGAYAVGKLAYAWEAGKFSAFNLTKVKVGLAAVGLVIGLAATWTQFGLIAASDPDPVTFNLALGLAIVNTIWLIFLFALNFIPVFGTLIAAILGLIDAIIGLVTGGEWSIARIILNFFYDAANLTKLKEGSPPTFLGGGSRLWDTSIGLTAGNSFVITSTLKGWMVKTSDGNNSDLRSSKVWGKLEGTSASDYAGVLSQNDASCQIQSGELVCVQELGTVFGPLAANINTKLEYVALIYYKYRWAEYGLYGAFRWATNSEVVELPEDEDDRDPTTAYLDVLPNNLDDLWNWSALVNPDSDGDGLISSRESSAAACASPATQQCTRLDLWDTDGDGLSDQWETRVADSRGTKAWLADTDGDGLSDREELLVGTHIADSDSDDDGLTDGEEVYHYTGAAWAGGWTARLPLGLTMQVYSDPLNADGDGDGMTDLEERTNQTSPYARNGAPLLTLTAGPLMASPTGDVGLYVSTGDPITLTAKLNSSGVYPITDTLSICLPAAFSSIAGGVLTGSRTPARQVGSCDGGGTRYSWSFAGQNTLQLFESITTTVTAQGAAAGSSSAGQIAIELPWTDRTLHKTVAYTLDVDNPIATVSAPFDGAILAGSTYVLGGNASDLTTWITHVEIDPGDGSGYQPAEGNSPWAYSWSLPGDGVYTMNARATDALGHTGTSAGVQVTVDNTPPAAALSGATNASGNIVNVSGTATDNLSGLARVQISINAQPWRTVSLTGAGTTSGSWTHEWRVGDDAQGTHQIEIRAYDMAGNAGNIVTDSFVIDRMPPTDELTDRTYLNAPPAVAQGEALTLSGVANDAGNVPLPARGAELNGALDILDDATLWLGMSAIGDNDGGVQVAWLGDINNDRMADLAVGLPAIDRVALVYGRAGNWTLPTDFELLDGSWGRLDGEAGAGLGNLVAPAGDVNGDGYYDVLIGEQNSTRAFVVFGTTHPMGIKELDGSPHTAWTILNAPAAITSLSTAGDANGDGFDDLLVSSNNAVYLLLGSLTPWPATIDVAEQAALVVNSAVRGVGLGDVDDDQLSDFAVTASNDVQLYLGDEALIADAGDSPTAAASLSHGGSYAGQVAALGDVSGDGLADFIYTQNTDRHLVYGRSSGGWSANHTFTGYAGFIAAPGDVNGDNRADILLGLGNANDDARLILGNDLGTVAATIEGVGQAASTPYAAGADINSDRSSDPVLVPSANKASSEGMDSISFAGRKQVSPDALPRADAPATGMTRGSLADRLAGSVRIAAAENYYVDDEGWCDGNAPCYDTIAGAIAAADNDGDTVIVYPGVYAAFTVPAGKDDLTIRGVNPDAVFVNGDAGSFVVRMQNVTGVTLQGLTLHNADVGVLLEQAGLGGAADVDLAIKLDTVVVHSVTSHALSKDHKSTVRLSRCTLGAENEHITVTGMSGEWSGTPEVTDSRFATGAGGGVFAQGDQIYILGLGGGDTFYRYDPDTSGWTTLANFPVPRGANHRFFVDGSGNMHLVQRGYWTRIGTLTDAGYMAGYEAAYDMTTDSAGNLYVSGDFTKVEGVSAPAHVAMWNGSAWTGIGNAIGGYTCGTSTGCAGSIYMDSVVVDGSDTVHAFKTGVGLWRWTGASWETDLTCCYLSGSPLAAYTDGILRLDEPRNREYIVGRDGAAWYDGSSWSKMSYGHLDNESDDPYPWYIRDVVIDSNGNAYMVGDFTRIDGAYSPCVTMWNGVSWSGVGGGLGASWMDAWGVDIDSSDNVYVAGDFTEAGGNSAANIAMWNGSDWSALGSGIDAPTVNDVVVDDYDNVVIAGLWIDYAGSVPVEAVARWNGRAWTAMGDTSVIGDIARRLAVGQNGDVFATNSEFIYQWTPPEVRPYDISGDSWSGPDAWAGFAGDIGPGASFTHDESGHVYAMSGSTSRDVYRLSTGTGAWEALAPMPANAGAGGKLIWTDGYVYALRGGDTRSFYRYDIAGDNWETLASLPSSHEVNAGSAAIDPGQGAIYVLTGGNTSRFVRYVIASDTWQVLPDAPLAAQDGSGLMHIGDFLFYVAGNGTDTLWRFGPLSDDPNSIVLDQVTFVGAQETERTWLPGQPTDAGLTDNGNNQWVAGASTTWSPTPSTTPLSVAQANFVDLARDVYRVSDSSALTAGYYTYQPDVYVYPNAAACERCGAGGDLTWTETAMSSIQDAIDSGAQQIRIRPGVYQEPFYLVNGVEIIGGGADLTIIEPTPGYTGTLVSAEGIVGASLARVTLTGQDTADGIRVEDGALDVTSLRNVIRDADTAIAIDGGSTDMEITNNTIVGNVNGVAATGSAPVDMRNTVIAYHSGTGLAYDGTASHTYNLYWANGTDQSPSGAGQGELFLDPLYQGFLSHDYRALDSSPLIDAGSPSDYSPPGAGTRIDI